MIDILKIKFSTDGLVPCVVQDSSTRVVLMLGYMNAEAIHKTLEGKRVTFFSRSKQQLWVKGETSGNFLEVINILVDCDQDTILIEAKPTGPVCHTGSYTCFNEENKGRFIEILEKTIQHRKKHPKNESYTTKLFESGINKVAQKVGEEAVELVIEAKDNNPNLFLNEAADLLYHYLVLLTAKGHSLNEVEKVLEARHR